MARPAAVTGMWEGERQDHSSSVYVAARIDDRNWTRGAINSGFVIIGTYVVIQGAQMLPLGKLVGVSLPKMLAA